MTHPIADLHCDLLLYLNGHAQRTARHLESRCSIPQLQKGAVSVQTMAIFTITGPGSASVGNAQLEIFKTLPKKYSEFQFFNGQAHEGKISVLPAIENASGFFEEEEDLTLGLARLSEMEKSVGRILYMSLTWNGENRFGGGCHTPKVGLKENGKALLEFLSGRKIAVDMSHTSDALAYDIFNFIDKKGLAVPVMASHSNFRRVLDVPRNLPDDIAKEIFRRGGVVGLNLMRSFVGKDPEKDFARHLEHALGLGGDGKVCFGADFFYENDIPEAIRKPVSEYFYDDYGNASVYGRVLGHYRERLGLSEEFLRGVASENFNVFLKRC